MIGALYELSHDMHEQPSQTGPALNKGELGLLGAPPVGGSDYRMESAAACCLHLSHPSGLHFVDEWHITSQMRHC